MACSNGACRVSCPGSQINCGGTCVDPLTSRSNCGASGLCGNGGGSAGAACVNGSACGNGTCQVSCPGAQINCGGMCVDPLTSRSNCGASGLCGNGGGSAGAVCEPGNVCGNGTCQVSCPSTQLTCGGVCVDPLTSPVNCGATGACGNGGGSAGAACTAGTFCSVGNCVPAWPSPAGLVAYYRGAGVDLSGNGANAAVSGNVTLAPDRFGNPNLAGNFDGDSNTYLEVAPNNALPVGNAARTLSVWLRTPASFFGPAGGLVNWGTSSFSGGRFGVLVAGTTDYFVGENADLQGPSQLTDDRWHQLVLTYDGLTVTTYVDLITSTSGQFFLNTGAPNLEIGRSSFDRPGPEPYFGLIDEVRVYDRVLTADERAALYFQGGWP